MTSSYEIVELAKEKKGIKSDSAFALEFGFTRQNINDWKVGRSEPKGINLLKLVKAADLDIDEALELLEKSKKVQREAGFGNVVFLSGIAAASLGAMTFSKMSALPFEALPALALAFVGSVYYVKLEDGQIFLVGFEIKDQLQWRTIEHLLNSPAANDIKFDQVSTHRIY